MAVKTKRVNFVFHPDMMKRLRKLAKDRDCTMTAVVEAGIEALEEQAAAAKFAAPIDQGEKR